MLHLGHLRHLETGQRAGDMLIVTITGDQYMNKGPGRPVFTDLLRAEMLAALDCVDYVGINQASSAEPALEIIRPSHFVKFGEYEDASKDITGKISAGQEMVERHGGSVLFTHDITFSSSSLINRHFDVPDPELRLFLQNMRDEGPETSIPELIEKVKNYRVVLVGDAIIDEYQYVAPMGKSWKENMIAIQYQGRRNSLAVALPQRIMRLFRRRLPAGSAWPRRGKPIEKSLYAEWGGKPSVAMLRWRDERVDRFTKQRCHDYLKGVVATARFPDAAEEYADPRVADEAYEAGTQWLLDHTKDTKAFPLLFKEKHQLWLLPEHGRP